MDKDNEVTQKESRVTVRPIIILRERKPDNPSATVAGGTVTTRLCSCQPAFDNGAGAANIRRDYDGVYRAVERTRAALHALIFLCNKGAGAGYAKDLMRTDSSAYAATDTFFFRQRERGDIFQIYMVHTLSYPIRLLARSKMLPTPTERTISGNAIFISFVTPEKEV